MMDAFNPADLDIGVQTLGALEPEMTEDMVRSYTDITDSYLLAMPSVSVNGSNFTANVITEPERFHISQGRRGGTDRNGSFRPWCIHWRYSDDSGGYGKRHLYGIRNLPLCQ